MDHLDRIAEEFTRQAKTFERWAEDADDASRLRAALGAAGQGRLVDIA